MMPSCDHTGFIHFHSSTTSGSAALMSLRILPRVFPRQSPSSAIRSEMSSDAEALWLVSDVFMFSSSSPAAPLDGMRQHEQVQACEQEQREREKRRVGDPGRR